MSPEKLKIEDHLFSPRKGFEKNMEEKGECQDCFKV
jgi:hypothetical protein